MKTSKALPIALVILTMCSALIALSACNTLTKVKTELGKGGFALWYPAEMGIRPGQIWQMKGQRKDIIHQQPAGLQLLGPSQARFETLKKEVDADVSLKADFAKGLLSNVGPIAAELKHGTVLKVSLEFGKTEIERLILSQFQDEKLLATLPDLYKNDLGKVKAGNQDYILIGAVVSTSGMKYFFKCENTDILAASAAKITELLGIEFKINIVSKTEAVWEIPDSARLAIGISPVSGEMLTMTLAQNLQVLNPVLSNNKLTASELMTALENRIQVVTANEKKSEKKRK